jgi:hypothetical protein
VSRYGCGRGTFERMKPSLADDGFSTLSHLSGLKILCSFVLSDVGLFGGVLLIEFGSLVYVKHALALKVESFENMQVKHFP